ncbi:MAG: hypothetical protein LC777_20255 [Actinobacteria bacterium]|nr:hypothetical protein [Actinomycetota bacterium]
MEEHTAKATRDGKERRPVSVTLVAVLALGLAIYSVAYGVIAIQDGEADRVADGIFHVVLGVGALAAAVGSFRLAAWGWTALMTWAVVALTHQLLRYLFFDDPNYADMAVSAFAVLALSPLDVQIAFGLRHTENVQLGRPTRNPIDHD